MGQTMISTSAIISTSGNDIYLSNISINILGNNISCDIGDLANKIIKTSQRPFLLGSSKLWQGNSYVNGKLDYFMSFSKAKDYSTIKLKFMTTTNKEKTLIFIVFDLINNAYPKYVTVDGIRYDLTSPILCFLTEAVAQKEITVTFYGSEWTKPENPITIQGIKTSYEIQSGELTNINFSGQDRSESSKPSWGIKSNSGSLEFRDNNGIIKAIKDVATAEDVTLDIYLKSNSKRSQIGSFIINKVNYTSSNKKSIIDFKDILESWDNINILFRPLQGKQTLYDFFAFILTKQLIKIADYTTERRFTNTYISYPYLEECSLWGAVTKFCEITACYVYCDEKGIPTIKYCGGA